MAVRFVRNDPGQASVFHRHLTAEDGRSMHKTEKHAGNPALSSSIHVVVVIALMAPGMGTRV